MSYRLLSWLFLGSLAAVVSLRAQAPASAGEVPQVRGGAEHVLVAKVSGSVTQTLNGVTSPVNVNDRVEQSARINTLRDSSVILVFSNGATTQLGEETELIIEEFLMDPFASTVKVAEITEEPSASTTRLRLNRGELVGNVKKLNRDRGSSFTVQTPVGAAGIRGTTFRIVFRPTGDGLAFNFQLSTVEGDVGFLTSSQQSQGGGQPGAGTDPAAPGQGAGDPGAGGTAVVTGQEVVITVAVEVSPTGQVTVTAPPSTTSTSAIPPQTQALLAAAAQEIAVASSTATFTAPTPGQPQGGGTTASTEGGGTTGTVTVDPTANAFTVTNNPASTTTPASRLTPGDGQPGSN